MNIIKRIIKTILLLPARLVLSKGSILHFILDKDERQLMKMKERGYLFEKGWFKAVNMNASVDADNNTIPWISYNAVQFIGSRLKKSFDIFEFGSGYSTLFYAAKVNSVTTVEHDKEWYDKISGFLPGNVTLIYKELVRGGDYCKTTLASGKKYDAIIVDGRDRVNCMLNSFSALKDNAVLILDDSGRDYYRESIEFYEKKGFRRIDLEGISPGQVEMHMMTIFYKSNNCFGI